ncbi:hypothetical protein ACFSUS_25625 [Spirosoma soli]|uniref:Uncharacterized protein n=1 Tax=Spirosoma soli TaxID=1770529 RepID=A0ABW5MER6_9BACT
MTRHANDLKYQIERILHWEPSEYWRLCDFTILSEQIMAHTDQWVEAQDLQRFWRSSAHATPALLNALARFADYADWYDFCARNQIGEMIPTQPDFFHAPMWEIPMQWVIVLCWLSVVASILVSILLVYKR